ncbi:energy transducer TonB [Stenotrophomonas sp.]|uniref:energy transducer TonB n=1 Tax=Stenotrophomonas sp. TaxID=69392 RepID=UPI0028AB1C64|nr:energy transducer TonB [Stenotrophomonas sp.]
MRFSRNLTLSVALVLGTSAAICGPSVHAQTARQVASTAESTMVLTGHIDIGTEGQVEGFHLDKRDSVPTGVAGFVDGQVKGWKFERIIVDGVAVPARTPVSIRLLAKPEADGGATVSLVAANFSEYRDDATDRVTRLKARAPQYPTAVFQRGGGGEVLLLVKVGRDGKVEDVFAEQVNLRWVGAEPEMQRMRDELARASVRAARGWTYRAPTSGESRNDPYWNVRVPVRFALNDDREVYGKWHAYIPGPRLSAPWRAESPADAGADLLPSGGVYMADAHSGPRLLTPLGG